LTSNIHMRWLTKMSKQKKLSYSRVIIRYDVSAILIAVKETLL